MKRLKQVKRATKKEITLAMLTDIEAHNKSVERIEKEKMPKEYDGYLLLWRAVKNLPFHSIKPQDVPKKYDF